ncbi:MAG: hypothetical protein JJE30_11065 [Desulfuromonadales bacterium]|nr:hypothetical protein [Desulfuromonadales bacterium]
MAFNLTPNDIDNVIMDSLESLNEIIFNGDEIKRLTDDENTTDNITMACEIAECFLIPALENIDLADNNAALRKRVLTLLPYNKAKKMIVAISDIFKNNSNKFNAGCYLTKTDVDSKKDYEIVDAAAFMFTTCLHFRQIYSENLKEKHEEQTANLTANLLDAAIDFLMKNEVKSDEDENEYLGWYWGGPGKKFKYQYFTYIALDAYADYCSVCNYTDESDERAKNILGEKAYANRRDIIKSFASVAMSLLKELEKPDKKLISGKMVDLEDDQSKAKIAKPDQSLATKSSYYFNLWIIYSILITTRTASSKGDLNSEQITMLDSALNKLADVYMTSGEGVFYSIENKLANVDDYDGKVVPVGTWLDRSFTPMFLKCFAIYYNKEGIKKRTEKSDEFVAAIYNELVTKRRKDGRWDRDKYSIYVTERSIEALVRLKKYLEMPPISKSAQTQPQLLSVATDKVTLPATIEINFNDLKSLVHPSANPSEKADITLENLASLLRSCLQDLGEFKDNDYSKTEIDKFLEKAKSEKKLGGASLEIATLIQGISIIGAHRSNYVAAKGE